MYILTQHGHLDLVLVLDTHTMADTGDTQVTLGATQDTGDLDGAILDGVTLDIGDHVITETILIITEEEVLQHTTEAAETIAQTEIFHLEETILQTEIILTEVSTTEVITTEAIQQIETTQTEQTAILTTEEALVQTVETTLQAQRLQTEEVQHKDKVTAMIIQTEDQALQPIEATTTPIAAHLELTLLAHRVQ